MTCVSSEDSSSHISVLRCLPRFTLPATGLHSALVRESSLSSGGQSTGRDIITQSAVRIRTLNGTSISTPPSPSRKQKRKDIGASGWGETSLKHCLLNLTWLLHGYCMATAIMNSWNQDYLHKTWHKIKPAPSMAANELQTFSHTDELSARVRCWGERVRPTDRFPELQ